MTKSILLLTIPFLASFAEAKPVKRDMIFHALEVRDYPSQENAAKEEDARLHALSIEAIDSAVAGKLLTGKFGKPAKGHNDVDFTSTDGAVSIRVKEHYDKSFHAKEDPILGETKRLQSLSLIVFKGEGPSNQTIDCVIEEKGIQCKNEEAESSN